MWCEGEADEPRLGEAPRTSGIVTCARQGSTSIACNDEGKTCKDDAISGVLCVVGGRDVCCCSRFNAASARARHRRPCWTRPARDVSFLRSHRGTCAAHLLLAKAPVGEGDAVAEEVGPSKGVPKSHH